MINLSSLAFTLLGVFLLIRALKSAYSIFKSTQTWGWCALVILISLFIVGYSLLAFSLYSAPQESMVNLMVAGILLGGSVFVTLVMKLSFSSIKALTTIAFQQQHNALHNNLTGLPNLPHLLQHLNTVIQQHQASSTEFAVILLDLDDFTSINDALGHATGDTLIRQFSARLTQCTPTGLFLAHIGSDEFALVCPETNLQKVTQLCQSIRSHLKISFSLEGHSVLMSTSPGVAFYPQHGCEANLLLKLAERAVRIAKQQKNSCAYTAQK
jgi:diguanylate cyclase (GGDEF)-like protein